MVYLYEGILYDTYDQYVMAKRSDNETMSKSSVADLKAIAPAPCKPLPVKVKRPPPIPSQVTGTRRSKRQRGDDVELEQSPSPTSVLLPPAAGNKPVRAITVHGNADTSTANPDWQPRVTFIDKHPQGLSVSEEAALEKQKTMLADFENFLQKQPHGLKKRTCSDYNVRCVIRTIMLLTAGVGISYKYWKDYVCFHKGKCVSLDDDLDDLLKKCVEFQTLHGYDRSNGWLMKHPIHKLRLYKCFKNGEACCF